MVKLIRQNRTNEKGAALLVVLFVVMAATVLSIGFLSKADSELASGSNFIVRTQMDSVAQSGLEHAKALLSNPQTVDTSVLDYWTGGTGLQIESGDDYYDVTVTRDATTAAYEYVYDITSEAYRLNGSDKVGRSNVQGRLRLHPVIAYWQHDSQTISTAMTINGSTYVWSDCRLDGTVNGDAYAAGQIYGTGTLNGSEHEYEADPLDLPGLSSSDYQMSYYYDGGGAYSVTSIANSYTGSFASAGMNNPAKVYYCSGDLALTDIVGTIQGTIVVSSNLRISSGCSFTIDPVKNMPALIVGDEIHIEGSDQSIAINGLVQVADHIDMLGKTNVQFQVDGAMYLLSDGIKNLWGSGSSVTVTADPVAASVEIWSSTENSRLWSPVGGAVFEAISRPMP
ncbi:Type II secretory pathway, component PulK [Anaerohalosphaera lusitana]|uniref:Type II secretory pathway, component PulK n=1 Tax=Anaerohalosphaera lusitana TaxID=1936003 RepID=A0A1U9NLW4_9BACT|nr:hypothetical protein [Anaerohalosphaera lusitana]AQT68899.1 Type II secretory pathway, component PulK [Anaerohalosphaera lusitana]